MTGDCAFCAYADERGWWGPDMPAGKTHCRLCHATLSAKAWHCVGGPFGGCCRTFSRDSHANKHRVKGRCVDPATLRTKGHRPVLIQRDDGVWASPPPDQPLPFWKGAA